MQQEKKISLEDVDFAKAKNDMDLMNIFIDFAEKNPNQGEKLFNKYVDFLCRKYKQLTQKEAKTYAANNIGYMAGYYEDKTSAMLFNVYKSLSRPVISWVRVR